jgi:hypothetical protein
MIELKSNIHLSSQGVEINYSDEQKRIIESKNENRKVKGFAGSGKTVALAKRAVNAHLRHGGDVLILYFNISLGNYIFDKINEVKETFDWSYFKILHYHEFKFSYNQTIQNIRNKRYKTILIDELQDFAKEWIDDIKKNYLIENGEWILFGDEKQKIYEQSKLDEEKNPYTGISGAWNIFKKSFRAKNDIELLAYDFQKFFFKDRYNIDEYEGQKKLFENGLIKYFFLEKFDIQIVISIYKVITEEIGAIDKDICFLSSKMKILRILEKNIRLILNKKTNITFITEEEYELIKSNLKKSGIQDKIKFEEKLKEVIKKNERIKKINFKIKNEHINFSTIQSFKGFEIKTLFLIIYDEFVVSDWKSYDAEGDETEVDKNEVKHVHLWQQSNIKDDGLIYTAITRCKQNLIIINIGNNKYHKFFSRNIY